MDAEEFKRISIAVTAAITRVLSKGSDDIFKPPIFSHSIENELLTVHAEAFREEAHSRAVKFLKSANLEQCRVGPTRRGLVAKDENTFRQVAWLDPFDAVNYLAAAMMVFPKIEAARIPARDKIVHSHRLSQVDGGVFDEAFGYDSFRSTSSDISKNRIGQWKVVTDIANFFDRIGNHSLENHLLDIGCDKKYVTLLRGCYFSGVVIAEASAFLSVLTQAVYFLRRH